MTHSGRNLGNSVLKRSNQYKRGLFRFHQSTVKFDLIQVLQRHIYIEFLRIWQPIDFSQVQFGLRFFRAVRIQLQVISIYVLMSVTDVWLGVRL